MEVGRGFRAGVVAEEVELRDAAVELVRVEGGGLARVEWEELRGVAALAHGGVRSERRLGEAIGRAAVAGAEEADAGG